MTFDWETDIVNLRTVNSKQGTANREQRKGSGAGDRAGKSPIWGAQSEEPGRKSRII